jgi:hypothetical protein
VPEPITVIFFMFIKVCMIAKDADLSSANLIFTVRFVMPILKNK